MHKAETALGNDELLSAAWVPDWPAPPTVRAVMTTRRGGVSVAPFDSLNFGDHVSDAALSVQINREKLSLALRAQPVFMRQVHGSQCVQLGPHTSHGVEADACVTQRPLAVCTVMVADCLPVLLCDTSGRTVGAAHAGWRGLAGSGTQSTKGVLHEFLRSFQALSLSNMENCASVSEASFSGSSRTIAWLGPCIGPEVFEVGSEVRQAFLAQAASFASTAACFEAVFGKAGKYRCDLAALARLQLAELGVTDIHGNDSSPKWCTASQPSVWFSYRRDATRFGSTGRMAACVWLT